MARPREFERDEALRRAKKLFWARGYAATSTDDLVAAMGIGRQSLYNAFGSKKALYLEALEAYQRASVAGHLKRLNSPKSPVAGLGALLVGLVSDDGEVRKLGCMGVSAVCEFGVDDPDIAELRTKTAAALRKRLMERLEEGQVSGEIDSLIDRTAAASFILMTMQSIQLAARAGADAATLRAQARFAIERLKAR